MAILDLISCVHLAALVTRLPRLLKYSTFSSFFNLLTGTEDGCLELLITIYFFTFFSILYYLSISINLPSMRCSRVSPLAPAQVHLYFSQCELLFFLFEVWCLWKLKCPCTFYWDCSCFGNVGHCWTLNGKLVWMGFCGYFSCSYSHFVSEFLSTKQCP